MKRNKVLIILAAALFGIVVWLSVNLREEYQVTILAPLSIQNIPEGWAIGNPIPKAIQMRIRGDGWRLALFILGPEIRLSIPYDALAANHSTSAFREAAERSSMRPGIQLLEVKPDSFSIGLEPLTRRLVPVVLDHAISMREGYGQVGTILITPDSVSVTGASSLVRRIESWRTTPGSFEDLKMPVDADLALAEPSNGNLNLSVRSVHVRINVEPFAEKILSGLLVDVTGLPPNREVILIPPKIEVVARGGIKQLSGLNPGDFRVVASYATIAADSSGSIEAQVTPPPGIQVVAKRPDRLLYIVRKRL